MNHLGNANQATTGVRVRGFSMIDLLVSIAVIAVLISLISPTLSHVRSAANKVVCASNLRQVGLCLTMYRDDHDSLLPQERRAATRSSDEAPDPQIAHTGEHPTAWSSLGWLVAEGYINTPQIFYCPSHEGTQTQEAYSDAWLRLDREIRTNYAYRGELARPSLDHPLGHAPGTDSGSPFSSPTSPMPSAQASAQSTQNVLVSDAFTSAADLNHASGFNTLTKSMSVSWLSDEGGNIQNMLSNYGEGVSSDEAWSILDRNVTPTDRTTEGVSGAQFLLNLFY